MFLLEIPLKCGSISGNPFLLASAEFCILSHFPPWFFHKQRGEFYRNFAGTKTLVCFHSCCMAPIHHLPILPTKGKSHGKLTSACVNQVKSPHLPPKWIPTDLVSLENRIQCLLLDCTDFSLQKGKFQLIIKYVLRYEVSSHSGEPEGCLIFIPRKCWESLNQSRNPSLNYFLQTKDQNEPKKFTPNFIYLFFLLDFLLKPQKPLFPPNSKTYHNQAKCSPLAKSMSFVLFIS